jgi:hypothetical protein
VGLKTAAPTVALFLGLAVDVSSLTRYTKYLPIYKFIDTAYVSLHLVSDSILIPLLLLVASFHLSFTVSHYSHAALFSSSSFQQFAHDGPWHLVANLALQLIFGLTIRLPSHYLMLVYEGGVCVGAITAATWLCNPWELARGLVGCSGGVYAILGLHAADLLLCPKQEQKQPQGSSSSQSHSGRKPPGQETYRSSRLLGLAAVVVADVVGTLLQDEGVEVSLESESGQSSWATHLGGGLFGLLIGLSGLLPYTGSTYTNLCNIVRNTPTADNVNSGTPSSCSSWVNRLGWRRHLLVRSSRPAVYFDTRLAQRCFKHLSAVLLAAPLLPRPGPKRLRPLSLRSKWH